MTLRKLWSSHDEKKQKLEEQNLAEKKKITGVTCGSQPGANLSKGGQRPELNEARDEIGVPFARLDSRRDEDRAATYGRKAGQQFDTHRRQPARGTDTAPSPPADIEPNKEQSLLLSTSRTRRPSRAVPSIILENSRQNRMEKWKNDNRRAGGHCRGLDEIRASDNGRREVGQ